MNTQNELHLNFVKTISHNFCHTKHHLQRTNCLWQILLLPPKAIKCQQVSVLLQGCSNVDVIILKKRNPTRLDQSFKMPWRLTQLALTNETKALDELEKTLDLFLTFYCLYKNSAPRLTPNEKKSIRNGSSFLGTDVYLSYFS